ncbi:PsbQ domain-containing protein [Cephalotus follicularis]|uniref:PsbQ domain-containing protein n=1 Tax=Cephalotus follicularis TaxID=3775 RepID=A0A1Q3DHA2_CEPFO|nr:PsbQ domain-containing protein [Cephalotus follicularis]
MVDVELKVTVCRVKKCAYDFLSIDSDLMDDDEESWNLMGRDICLKSTFLYCDCNRMISQSPKDQKEALTVLANKLFCSIEELDHAVKIRNIALTQDRYNEAAIILQELMAIMP